MREVALLIVAGLSAYLGFALLALSQNRHWQAVTGEAGLPPARRSRLRVAGWLLLAVCLLLAWLRDGAAFGSLLGVFLLTTTGLSIAFTLAWRGAWLRRLAAFAQNPAAQNPAAQNPARRSASP